MADAGIPVRLRDRVDLGASGGDAGQVGCRLHAGLGLDARHRGMRSLARGAARAVRHGDETRRQRRQALDRRPQARLHLLGPRWEELEAELGRRLIGRPAVRLEQHGCHDASRRRPDERPAFERLLRTALRRPQRDGQWIPGQMLDRAAGQAGPAQPGRHLLISKAEPDVSVLVAQPLDLVTGEVHHDEKAAPPQDPRGLGQRLLGILEEVQNLVHEGDVEALVGERQGVHVAVTHLPAPGIRRARAWCERSPASRAIGRFRPAWTRDRPRARACGPSPCRGRRLRRAARSARRPAAPARPRCRRRACGE